MFDACTKIYPLTNQVNIGRICKKISWIIDDVSYNLLALKWKLCMIRYIIYKGYIVIFCAKNNNGKALKNDFIVEKPIIKSTNNNELHY